MRVDDFDLEGDEQYPNEESLVVNIFINVNLTTTGNSSFLKDHVYTGESMHGSFIRFSFELSCAENFYGEDCTSTCYERDDEEGYFVCNSDGNLECMEGFQEISTNCTKCVLANDCCKLGQMYYGVSLTEIPNMDRRFGSTRVISITCIIIPSHNW